MEKLGRAILEAMELGNENHIRISQTGKIRKKALWVTREVIKRKKSKEEMSEGK